MRGTQYRIGHGFLLPVQTPPNAMPNVSIFTFRSRSSPRHKEQNSELRGKHLNHVGAANNKGFGKDASREPLVLDFREVRNQNRYMYSLGSPIGFVLLCTSRFVLDSEKTRPSLLARTLRIPGTPKKAIREWRQIPPLQSFLRGGHFYGPHQKGPHHYCGRRRLL